MLLKKLKLTSKYTEQLMILLIALLVIVLLTLFYSSINNHLQQKRSEVLDFSNSLQKRIDSYRYTTWQILDSLSSPITSSDSINEIQLKSDVFALNKSLRKTETLIFGVHDKETLHTAQQLSAYMDTLWGANKGVWSLYYLNGQDNSLTAISTQPLQEMLKQYQASEVINLASTRRAEMLQQANMLDERESFSDLRTLNTGLREHYLTLRTTFNQPGHLTTVLAFDLPIDDLLIDQLSPRHLQLRNNENISIDEQQLPGISLSLSSFNFDITQALTSTPLMITYHLSLGSVLKLAISDYTLSFLLLILLLSLAIIGFAIARKQLVPVIEENPQNELMRHINQEIISIIPMGFLIYDIEQQQTVVTNEIADNLLPHLNFSSMLEMSDQHQLLQVTINNEIYEVRFVQSHTYRQYRFFIIREQEQELLVNKKLKLAQKVLNQNHQQRRRLFDQLGEVLNAPIAAMSPLLAEIAADYDQCSPVIQQLQTHHLRMERLLGNIILLNQLESDILPISSQPFEVTRLVEEIVSEILPTVMLKGLNLIVDNRLPLEQQRLGSKALTTKLFTTLFAYSLESTNWGKIKVVLSSDNTDRLIYEIIDTSPGLEQGELDNSDFPFISAIASRSIERSSAMDLFFCRKLTQKLNGSLKITSKLGIGTHYRLSLPFAVSEQASEESEPLLEDISLLIDIVNEDVRRISCRMFESWGARCFSIEERYSGQVHDLIVTDNLSQLENWGLLLTQDHRSVPLEITQRQACFNLSQEVLEALLSLIEAKLTDQGQVKSVYPQSEIALQQSEYFQIFAQTVPQDIDKLYTEHDNRDYNALALTAHRLKGVFAMLSLHPGHQLCEQLEDAIRQLNDVTIKETISVLEQHVKTLLQ